VGSAVEQALKLSRVRSRVCFPPNPRQSPRLSENFNISERLGAIRAHNEFKPEHEDAVHRDLSALQGIRNYDVGVTEFETDEYKLATELFVRFNSTGGKLLPSSLAGCPCTPIEREVGDGAFQQTIRLEMNGMLPARKAF
jgi:hypothetical protein